MTADAPVFSVVTPTYDRADTLHRVRDSLVAQTVRDLEWIIVDDGSTDDTPSLVAAWAGALPFPVRYIRQEHAHKKVALNRGVQAARGRFLVIADSDDSFMPESLETFLRAWEDIPEADRDSFVGVTAHCVDEAGDLVGTPFPTDPFDSDSVSARHLHGITGEKWGMQRMDVMRCHPFPEFLNGAVPEGVVWEDIAARYRTRYIDARLRTYYTSGPSIIQDARQAVTRMEADGTLYHQARFLDRFGARLLVAAPASVLRTGVHFLRFAVHQFAGGRRVRWWPRRLLSNVVLLAVLPLATALVLRDRLRARHR